MREARRTGGHGEDDIVDPLVGWSEAGQEQDQTGRHKQIDDGPQPFLEKPQTSPGNNKAKCGGDVRFLHGNGLSSVWTGRSQRGQISVRSNRENRVPSNGSPPSIGQSAESCTFFALQKRRIDDHGKSSFDHGFGEFFEAAVGAASHLRRVQPRHGSSGRVSGFFDADDSLSLDVGSNSNGRAVLDDPLRDRRFSAAREPVHDQ